MNLIETAVLGAIAGFTIYLGLPFARLSKLRMEMRAFMNALAIGILVFLLWDVLTKAHEPINAAMDAAKRGEPSDFVSLLALFAVGFGVGLIGLVYVDRFFVGRKKVGVETSPYRLALMIATAIGVHNLAEGLAIGQASREGALQLAAVLVIGFGLHNMTEGFGIAAPLAMGPRPSWGFLGLAGFIGGGPTFLGTVVGYSVQSTAVFVLCLALAGGSIFYVVAELLHMGRRFQLPAVGMWGIFLGFLAGFGTDLILSWAGA